MSSPLLRSMLTDKAVKVSVRQKDTANNEVQSIVLHVAPASMDDADIVEAARHGINIAVKSVTTDVNRSKNATLKDRTGDIAAVNVAYVVGYTMPEPKPTAEAEKVLHGAPAMSVTAKAVKKKDKDIDAVPVVVGGDGFAK